MTRDADEYNDSYKIDIRLEDDGLRRYFENGLCALLADEHFLLLYVPENGGRMQVIQPANNSYHRKRMIKMANEAKGIPSFYYALSHLWGLTNENRYHWNDISEYVDDEEGQPVKPVLMRPEKRDALLALLEAHPGSYWWIDVLCARTDTPLDIMGDIYACCLECIAMIDCTPSLIQEIHEMSEVVDEIEELCRIININRGDDDPEVKHPSYQQLDQTQLPKLVERLQTFFQSRWWQRVWTWQELALPVGCVRFMAEADTWGHQTKNTITVYDLLEFGEMFSYLRYAVPFLVRSVDISLSGIYEARKSNSSRDFPINPGGNFVAFFALMQSLISSKRRCYDPADYVYGVLGMMQIKIPRMADPNAVWRHLLSKLDDLYPLAGSMKWIDCADEIDLRKVEAIGDVYTKLFSIYAESMRRVKALYSD